MLSPDRSEMGKYLARKTKIRPQNTVFCDLDRRRSKSGHQDLFDKTFYPTTCDRLWQQLRTVAYPEQVVPHWSEEGFFLPRGNILFDAVEEILAV